MRFSKIYSTTLEVMNSAIDLAFCAVYFGEVRALRKDDNIINLLLSIALSFAAGPLLFFAYPPCDNVFINISQPNQIKEMKMW